MNNNLEKIKELILKSDISDSEKIDLITLFSKAKDEELEPVSDLFSNDLSWVKKISENYKAKQVANITENSDLWKKIINEEEKELKEISS